MWSATIGDVQMDTLHPSIDLNLEVLEDIEAPEFSRAELASAVGIALIAGAVLGFAIAT